MKTNYMLSNQAALNLYEQVKALPIIDYHCHLSPKEIYEDLPFDNIGEIWLAGDHYKWRLMRAAGYEEHYITGAADWKEKFVRYIAALEFAPNNPLYHWSQMELNQFFAVTLPLTAENAEAIWEQANAYLKEHQLSPRKLIEDSNVEVICTTDDLADDLSWHQKIKEQGTLKAKVLPSYRYDNLLLMRREGYADYIAKLAAAAGFAITDLASLKKAIAVRLDYFYARDCRITDVGIPFFPKGIASEQQADQTFAKALAGEVISDAEYYALLGNLYLYFGKLFAEKKMLSQWHLAVTRNSNSSLFARCGADCGVDCIGESVSGSDLIAMLDAMQKENALPQTIVYSLNPQNLEQIACIAGAFPGVRCGAAWWFNDHKRGIREQMEIISEYGVLGRFYGMLTDSRSFLSYARHDYFRRILCSMVGDWVEAGEYEAASAVKVVSNISYDNIKQWMEEHL